MKMAIEFVDLPIQIVVFHSDVSLLEGRTYRQECLVSIYVNGLCSGLYLKEDKK